MADAPETPAPSPPPAPEAAPGADGAGGPDARPPIPASRKALYLLVLLAIGLLATEGIMRVDYRIRYGDWDFAAKYDPARQERLYEAHPTLRFAPIPGATLDKVHKGIRHVVTINALGFRGEEISAEKPPGAFRIACLGGSTTFDTGATDDAHTWPGQLARLLREARPGRKIEVVNAGCPSYTTLDSLINLKERVGALQPDLVIVFHAINDITVMTMPGFTPDYSHRPLPGEQEIGDGDSAMPVLRRSILYLKIRRKIVRKRASDRREAWRENPDKGEQPPEAGLAVYEKNLRAIVEETERIGAKPMLMAFVRPFRLDRPPSATFEEELGTFVPNLTWQGAERAIVRCNEIARRVAEEEGALFADPNQAVGADEAHFADWIHMNDEGSERFAGVVAEAILASGALDE